MRLEAHSMQESVAGMPLHVGRGTHCMKEWGPRRRGLVDEQTLVHGTQQLHQRPIALEYQELLCAHAPLLANIERIIQHHQHCHRFVYSLI